MKKKILSLILCLVMCFSLIPIASFAIDGTNGQFTMDRVPGSTQKDVIVNGEHRVIYCMQYDYLWPVTDQGYANPPTKYTEASSVDLLNEDQQAIIQRVLYAGYPYDSIGALAPLYENLDVMTAADAAANMTQGIIWSFMYDWNVPGNAHYISDANDYDSDIPGWNEAYASLLDYALNGDPLPQAPGAFTPVIIGNTTFAKQEESWMTGALSISDPDGFKIMYNLSVPDDVLVLDENGYALFPNWDFINGDWVNLGYTIYGGETFYLQTEHGPSVEGEAISFNGSVKLPTDIKQYVTTETGLGNKNDGQGYVQHNFQTMLSVGISFTDYAGSAVLHTADETVTVSGHKTWIHGDNPISERPTEITVHLHANGIIKDSIPVHPDPTGNWTWSFDNLPKFDESGAEIVYTVDEGYVHNYSASYHGYNIINTYDPDKTSINVEKIWDDENDHDGFRPSSVTVKLFANGDDTGKTVTLTDIDNWRGVFEDLDEKSTDGTPITYTVEEVPVDGYTSSCETQIDADGNTVGFIIKNTHAASHVSVAGTKTWDLGSGAITSAAVNLPASITVILHADGVAKESKTVTAANGWKWNFTDLDKYNHGTEIVYTVSEMSVPNFTPSYDADSFDITNTYAPETTSISVVKVWNDDHDRDAIRPEYVTVNLLANLQPTGRTLTLDETNRWEDAFTGLNVIDAEGNPIHYSVTENHVDGYRTVITGSDTLGYVITNSHTPETVDISGQKTWNDASNQDGKRPASITVHLLADGTPKDSVTVTEADGWKWNFTGLYKNEGGEEITYSVIEDRVDDYSTSYQGYNITNSYTPGKTSVSVEKRWDDDHNRDGVRPAAVQVRLLADGVAANVPLLTLNEAGEWRGTFSNLDEYKNGTPITYTVEEVTKVEGYFSIIGGDEDSGFVITNSYTPELTELFVEKVWEDGDDIDALRPEKVHINIYADGVKIDTLTLSHYNEWKHAVTDLNKYNNGVEIVYTIDEDAVAGYEAEITGDAASGFTVVNKHTPAPRGTLVVSKTVMGDAADTDKEFDFTVTLGDDTVNGVYGEMTFVNGVASFTLKDGETKTAENLTDGIEYTVTEADYSADGYVTEKSGDEGTIIGGETVKAEFINTKNSPEKPEDKPTTPTKPENTTKPSAPTSPQTGADRNMSLWFVLLFVSSIAFAVCTVLGLKRKKN